jgi:hypothetical protein
MKRDLIHLPYEEVGFYPVGLSDSNPRNSFCTIVLNDHLSAAVFVHRVKFLLQHAQRSVRCKFSLSSSGSAKILAPKDHLI